MLLLIFVLLCHEAVGLVGDNLVRKGRSVGFTINPNNQRCFDESPHSFALLYQAENEMEFQDQGQEDIEDLEDDEEEDNPSEEYAQQSLLQLYARDREWLAKATEVVLDHNHYPLGSLTLEDVDKITVLMVSWVRQRSIKAALSVENLLKRVVDDMRANNKQVHVTAKMYALVSASLN